MYPLKSNTPLFRQILKQFLPVLVLVSMGLTASAQNPTDSVPPDPGSIAVYTIQNLSFGAFSNGLAGGTVNISNTGVRSVTGDVVALNLGVSYFQSIFEIDAPQGSIISIMNGADAILNGSNGGSITMKLGNADPASPFITTVPQPARTVVNIGGKITLGSVAANPPGLYSGTFYVTFNQE